MRLDAGYEHRCGGAMFYELGPKHVFSQYDTFGMRAAKEIEVSGLEVIVRCAECRIAAVPLNPPEEVKWLLERDVRVKIDE